MPLVPVEFVRVVDASALPFVVEVELLDAEGHRRAFFDKEPIFFSSSDRTNGVLVVDLVTDQSSASDNCSLVRS